MATASGTATGYGDLMGRLKAFLEGSPGWVTQRYIPAGPVGGGAYVASSQYDTSNTPALAFDGIVSGDVGWRTAAGFAAPSWISVQLDNAVAIKKFSVRARSVNPNRAPQDFALERSPDGTTWTNVQSVTAATAWTANERREYTNTATTQARFWRLNITANNTDASYTEICEIEMYDDSASTTNLAISSGVPEWIVKGPGLASADEIFVGFRRNSSAGADYWNWQINGMIGYVAGNTYATQPGLSATKSLLLSNDSIPYWFVANGRRFVVVAKIGTIYEVCYGGFILPYATPAQYPYPLLVGATYDGATAARWSDTSANHSVFASRPASGALRFTSGAWLSAYDIWPTSQGGGGVAYSYRNTPANDYPLLPIEINDSGPNRYGYLDGVYFVPGYSAAAEDIVAIGGTNHLMIPNIFRSGLRDFIALALT